MEYKKSNSVPGSNSLQVSFRNNHPNLNMFYLHILLQLSKCIKEFNDISNYEFC